MRSGTAKLSAEYGSTSVLCGENFEDFDAKRVGYRLDQFLVDRLAFLWNVGHEFSGNLVWSRDYCE